MARVKSGVTTRARKKKTFRIAKGSYMSKRSRWRQVVQQVERSLRWMAKVHASGKGCAWNIEDRKSNAFVGAIRFNSFDKKWRCGQIGYESHPDFWGRGLIAKRSPPSSPAAIGPSASPHRSLDAAGQRGLGPRAGEVRLPS